MLNFISKSLKKVFGTKYDRDVAAYSPVVERINEIYGTLSSLSNDELRNKTLEFRATIADYLTEINKDIDQLTEAAKQEADFAAKEDLYNEIDQLKEARDKQL